MARFIQPSYPTEHAGLIRVIRGLDVIGDAIRSFKGPRGTATLLLAALVSALVVVANELVTAWTDGHLFAAWIAAWLVGFAALAMLAGPVRRAASRVWGSLKGAAALPAAGNSRFAA